MSNTLLVFDIGTTGARTILYNAEGREILKFYEEYPIERQPPGISEQDPVLWWNAIRNTCKKVVKNKSINPADIIGISAAFHRATTTIIDKKGNILHPALTWMDEREVTDIKIFQEEGALRRAIPKILWIKNNHPNLFNKAYKIISPDSYFYMKLCGEIATDPSNGIYGILNMETLSWDETLAEDYDLPIDLWPNLYAPGDIIGELSGEAAAELELKQGLPIVVGGGDQQCAALGLGVTDIGQAKATTGTGTFVDMVVEHPIPSVGDIPIFSLPHVVKNKWVLEGTMPGTGTALKWFRDNFSQLQIKECKEKNMNIYDILSEEAKKVPPGSEGLLILPLYIFKKGTIYGLGFGHSREYFIRAIMESAALSAQVYLSLLEGMAKRKVDELRVDGGGMNSDLWSQIFADVIMKPIRVAENKDGAGLGAAILGFCGLKFYSNYEESVKNMVRFEELKQPIKENSKIYKKLIRVFMPAVLDILNKKRITGKL
ncbi:MAG: FGGY-family carbohydrate kinase [Candidatus Helarchaeota archaeon]